MLLIVAHHYVVNSGLLEVMYLAPFSTKSIYYFLFGMWGKTGINSFVLITGYFMCTKKITLKKFLKLVAEVYFYKIIIFSLFLIFGRETITPLRLVKLAMPFWGIKNGFVGCFLLFYLLIPFLSVVVQNVTKKQHEWLLVGLFIVFTILGTIPEFNISFNYVGWFCVLFFYASYIRLYPNKFFERTHVWGWISAVMILLAMLSVVVCVWAKHYFGFNTWLGYWFVEDCNKIMALLVALSSFIWFKNIKIRQNRIINSIAASTFGIFLIHANSTAMRQWLWVDTLNCAGKYDLSFLRGVLYSFGGVVTVFMICFLLDRFRLLLFGLFTNKHMTR